MEKVIVAHGYKWLGPNDVDKVNCALKEGWTVKSVTALQAEGDVTAIFVLEKNNEFAQN